MKSNRFFVGSMLFGLLIFVSVRGEDLSGLKQNQSVAGFAVSNLYSDGTGKIVGVKFIHISSSAPVYVIQIETAPQAFMWIDAPPNSNRGLAHSLEHLLAKKGTKGRYLNLLRVMRLSQYGAASFEDYNLYVLASGTGMTGFEEQLDAFFDALFKPDFSDVEAEREFYHVGLASDTSGGKHLVEQGTVYNEEQAGDGTLTYYFELNKRQFGEKNPFGFNIGGVPDDMRSVTPEQIRDFHSEHYRLGPGTGFIFVLPQKEDLPQFLEKISADFSRLPVMPHSALRNSAQPKYAVAPSADRQTRIFSFPSSNESDRGQIRLGWAPVEANSQVDIRLLQLFVRALAGGERSLLFKSLIDTKSRILNSEATSIDSEVFLGNSPLLPAVSLLLSGIPGNQLTAERIQKLRDHILSRISQIANYEDNSEQLLRFNQLVISMADAWERDQRVWVKSAPLFAAEYKTDWKEHLNYLEANPSFIRSLTDESVWQEVGTRLKGGRNLWRDVIREFQLSSAPYVTASAPSPQLLAKKEEARQRRLQAEAEQLKQRFHAATTAKALKEYEQIESRKTRDINEIDARITTPRFTDHPPLTPDDDAQYRQFQLARTPVLAVCFHDAPTIDLGLSFDLKDLPQKYYKYLPILPRSFDSVGLRSARGVTLYSDLLSQEQQLFRQFSLEYESNAVSRRADLAVRFSVTSPQELDTALRLIGEMLKSSDLEITNADRLRDLVNQRIADDDDFTVNDSLWLWKTADAFRHQKDPLYTALNSQFRIAHWDWRLKWLLHESVSPAQLQALNQFSEKFLSSLEGVSPNQFPKRLAQLQAEGIQRELVQYWLSNLSLLPDAEQLAGLRRLTAEVLKDLATGPQQTLKELKQVQELVINRNALKIDITLDPALLTEINPSLNTFSEALPEHPITRHNVEPDPTRAAVMANVERRAGVTGDDFPWVVGFEDSRDSNGGVVFSSDFLSYQQLDRSALIKALASKLGSGTGPHTFFMKTFESGLAYSTAMASDPGNETLMYYADRVPDIAALVQRVNSFAAELSTLGSKLSLDYTLQKAFPFQRSMLSFTERGKSLARDIYDGKTPATIRRYSGAILNLRSDPNLMNELAGSAIPSIAPVLLESRFRASQRANRSIFFFSGPERMLQDTEKRMAIPKLLRIYPADFWAE